MTRLEQVVHAHQGFIADQLERNGVAHWHGRARFVSPHVVEVRSPDGTIRRANGAVRRDRDRLEAAQSRRACRSITTTSSIAIRSSTLSYLPRSLAVIGSGVIATEYACIFAALGVARHDDRQVAASARVPRRGADERGVARVRTRQGGTYLGDRSAKQIVWDGLEVHTTLDDSRVVRTEKLLYCLGREANLAGPRARERRARPDDARPARGRRVLPHDRPAHLRGRRRDRSAVARGDRDGTGPARRVSRARHHAAGVGGARPGRRLRDSRARDGRPDRGAGARTPRRCGRRPRALQRARARSDLRHRRRPAQARLRRATASASLGVHVVGEGATELVHVGQVAIVAGWDADAFVDNVFNFPTLAEAYRVAALDVCKQRKLAGCAPSSSS